MNNALLYIGGFLVIALAALFAVPTMIDWNGYRGVFEEEASKVLGRDVRVSGDVNVRFLPTPYVRFEKLRLADVSGQTGQPFLSADSFTMWLAISPLIRGVLEANKIELERPVLKLALDDKGGGNWSSIRLQPGSLPFVPRDVTLHSVKLIDGTVAIFNASAQSVMRVEKINGELAADGLAGPVRFGGTAAWGGEARDLRFATSSIDADGSFTLKTATRSDVNQNTLLFDGKVEAISSQPKFSGALTGTFAMVADASAGSPQDGNLTIGQQKSAAAAATLDFKAIATGDASSAMLSDIVISIENAIEPQRVTGMASAKWTGTPRLDVQLSSKWLDLDRLAGRAGQDATFAELKKLADGLLVGVAGDGDASANIDLENVKIAGEAAGGLKINAQRSKGAVRITELQAGLPGGSRLLMSGDIDTADNKPKFDGQVFIHGASLARLKAWAEKSGVEIDLAADGPFSLDSRVRFGSDRIDLSEMSVTIGSGTMTGEVHIVGDGQKRADITIESSQIDSAMIFPKMTGNLEAALRGMISPKNVSGEGTDRTQAAKAVSQPATPSAAAETVDDIDISLRVLAGELKQGPSRYRDVDARVMLQNGTVRIPSATFRSVHGLQMRIEGEVEQARTAPKGRMAFDVVAADATAMADAVDMFGVGSVVSVERARRIGSMRLAGLVRVGQDTSSALDVQVDGMVGGAKVFGIATLADGAASWRTAPSRISVTAEGDDLADVAALAAGISAAAAPADLASTELSRPTGADATGSAGQRPTRASLSTSGRLSQAATLKFDLATDGVKIDMSGSVTIAEQHTVVADGSATITTADVRDVLGLIGVSQPRGLTGVPLDGLFDVGFADGAWRAASSGFGLGGAIINGIATVAKSDDGRTKIAAEIKSNHVSVSGLLAAIVDKPLARDVAAHIVGVATDEAVGDDAEADAKPVSVWPDGKFDTSLMSNVDGDIVLAFEQFSFTDALTTGTGSMTIALADQSLQLKSLSAKAAGGDLTGDLALTFAANSVVADTHLRLNNGDASSMGQRFAGRIGFDVKARGRIQSPSMSPAAVVASLTGDGTATVADSRVTGPDLSQLRALAAQILEGKIQAEARTITDLTAAAAAVSSIALGTQTATITIADGVAQVAPVETANPDGKLTNRTTLNLVTQRYDSAWQAAVLPPPLPTPPNASADIPGGWQPSARSTPLSALAIGYTGRMDDMIPAPPLVGSDAFLKDLVLLQTERQVNDLERIRLLDGERARVDLERRRAQAADREAQAAQKAAERAAASANRNQSVSPQPGVESPPISTDNSGAAQPTDATLPNTINQQEGGAAPPGLSTTQTGTITVDSVDVDTAPPVDGANDPGARPATARPRQRPQRPVERRRTPSDEIMRSLGAVP